LHRLIELNNFLLLRSILRETGSAFPFSKTLWLLCGCLVCLRSFLFSASIGLPPFRFYSLEEIGDVTPGFRLGFDPLGRVAIVRNNQYLVLNDDEWLNLLEDEDLLQYSITQVAFSGEDNFYFSSHGYWGKLEKTAQGKYNPVSLSPEHRPEWTLSSEFDHILITDTGVFFYNWNGIVYLDQETGETYYKEVVGLDKIFEYHNQIYAFIISGDLIRLEMGDGCLEAIQLGAEYNADVEDDSGSGEMPFVFFYPRHGFFAFDGHTSKPLKTELNPNDIENIVDFCFLQEGNLAVVVDGKGIFILSASGKILSSIVSAEFRGVKEIITNEPGVFWYSSDFGIGKVYYGSGVTVVDQRTGMQIGWPDVSRWNDGLIIESSGRVYEAIEDDLTGSIRFEQISDQPGILATSVAGCGDFMFVGNAEGVFGKRIGGNFELIVPRLDVGRIVPINHDLCVIIGSSEISAIRREGQSWKEFTQRIPGYGFPPVVHLIKNTVWVEFGLDRAVMISIEGDQLKSVLWNQFPWKEPTWVNIGLVGDTVILSGRGNERIYYDLKNDAICEAPAVDQLLNLCPFGVWRTVDDNNGTIWVSHKKGVSAFRLRNGEYYFDAGVGRFIKEPTPVMRLQEDGNLWVTSRESLFCVERGAGESFLGKMEPVLVSVVDARKGQMIKFSQFPHFIGELDYDSNNLTFRFFAGNYAFQKLSYRVDVETKFTQWSIPEADSQLTIPNLKEGRYRMRVQLMDAMIPVGTPLCVGFSIRPPFYRTGYAYFLYFVGLVLLSVSMAAFPVIYIKKRNRVLSGLVEARTHELQETIEKLRIEERNSAIHEERNRIANEIHDSVQQGLSGLKLLLDSTLKFDSISDELRIRLNKAKSILAFTHQEVKHAVWDMETPLLEDENLKLALEKLASFASSKQIEIIENGPAVRLPASMNHHLIRIVQESITNAIRHGNAGNICITLHYQPEHVIVSVEDDGSGFVVDAVIQNQHQLGLRGMQSRAERIKGKLSIESTIGKGTRIEVKIPSKAFKK